MAKEEIKEGPLDAMEGLTGGKGAFPGQALLNAIKGDGKKGGQSSSQPSEGQRGESESRLRRLDGSVAHLSWDTTGFESPISRTITVMRRPPKQPGRWVSAQSGMLAYGLAEGKLRVLKLATGERIILRGHLGFGMTWLEFGPPGSSLRVLASAGEDGTVLVWGIEAENELNGKLLLSLEPADGSDTTVSSIAWSGWRLALAVGGRAYVVDVAGALEQKQSSKEDETPSIALSDGACDGAVRECATSSSARAIAFSPGGRHVAAFSKSDGMEVSTLDGDPFSSKVLASVPIGSDAVRAAGMQVPETEGDWKWVIHADGGESAELRVAGNTGAIEQRVDLSTAGGQCTVSFVNDAALAVVSCSNSSAAILLGMGSTGKFEWYQGFSLGQPVQSMDAEPRSHGEGEIGLFTFNDDGIRLLSLHLAESRGQIVGPCDETTLRTDQFPPSASANKHQPHTRQVDSDGDGGATQANEAEQLPSRSAPSDAQPELLSVTASDSAVLPASSTEGDANAVYVGKESQLASHQAAQSGVDLNASQALLATLKQGEEAKEEAKEEKNLEPEAEEEKKMKREEDAGAGKKEVEEAVKQVEARMEKVLAEQMEALREERERRNEAEKERHKRLVEAMAETVTTEVPRHLENALSKSIDDAVGRIVQGVKAELQSVPDQVGKRAESACKKGAEEASKKAFKEQVVPSLESAASEAFRQMNAALTKGVEDAKCAMERAARGAAQSGQESQAKALSAHELEQKMNWKLGLLQRARDGDMVGAFTDALHTEDVGVVVWLCKQLRVQDAFTAEGPLLPQHVLLSLIDFLGRDPASSDTAARLQWINEAVQAIDTKNTKLAQQVESTLTDLRTEVLEVNHRLADDAQVSRLCRLTLQTINVTLQNLA